MNVFVIATASRTSGALSIYKQFVKQLETKTGNDHYFVFVDPSMPQTNIPRVQYITSNTHGLRRVFFDFWGFKRAIKQTGVVPDLILSLQNTGVKYPKVPQIIYFHNILPLHKKLWNPFKRSSRTLFFYASLYPLYIRMLINKRMNVIVQANFIKPLFVDRFRFPHQQIHVIRPHISIADTETDVATSPFSTDTFNFIYPALGFGYKNHLILVNALGKLIHTEKEKKQRLVLHFTLKRGENKSVEQRVKELGLTNNVVFHGQVSKSQLFAWYQHATALVFPSWLETLGLPLIEAASCGLPIIACDTKYAREALEGYQGVSFAKQDKVDEWAKSMHEACNKQAKYPLYKHTDNTEHEAWDKLFELIHKQYI